MEMINLLLAYGAQPFLTTILKDSMSFGGNAQRGSYSAICVASAHGQRSTLHKLISHPLNTSAYSLNSQGKDDILSLEEILAEGAASQLTTDRKRPQVISSMPFVIHALSIVISYYYINAMLIGASTRNRVHSSSHWNFEICPFRLDTYYVQFFSELMKL